jgi:uncharacterized protein (UPF0335 family)
MTDTPDMDGGDNASRAAAEELLSFVERIERLQRDKAESAAEFAEDIKNVKAEAKARGHDMKALAEVLRRRKLDDDTKATADLYEARMGALG